MPETQIKGYAIVDYSGFQFRVETGQELKVPFAAGDPGANLHLDRVLLLHDGTTTHFGTPAVEGAVVDATILSHGREPKVTVFKFRRRKGYRRKRGHRQDFSMLRINSIRLEKAPAAKPKAKPESKAAPKKTAAPKTKTAAPKAKTAEPKKKEPATAAEKKTTAPKKKPASTTAKKPAAPKKPAPAKKSGGTKKTTAAKKTTAGKTTAAKKTGGSTKKSTSAAGTKKKSSE